MPSSLTVRPAPKLRMELRELTCSRTAPALEAVYPVIKKFKPSLLFQSESSDAVEAAWNSILGEDGGSFLALSPEVSAKLGHESVESLWEPGKQVYGISMYHQLHCLNTIRRSFYREKFFPDMPNDRFYFHKSRQNPRKVELREYGTDRSYLH